MSETNYASRRRATMRLVAKADKKKANAFLVTRPEDVGYLTGFSGEDSFVLLGLGWSILLTDRRFGEQAQNECPGVEICVRSGSMVQAIAQFVRKHRIRCLAAQSSNMTIQQQCGIRKAMPRLRILPIGDVLGELRQIKDEGELAAIRKAVKVAQQAFLGLISRGAKSVVGRTEREVAAELEYRMRLAGADKSSFETIVAVGSHASLPHYRPGGTRIRRNQPVLIDWGAEVSGYCSDLTRVVVAGKIPPKVAEVYEVVRRAQKAGILSVRAGVKASTVDGAARKVIADAGFAKQFIHSLGHGVGRVVHEMPGVGQSSKATLRTGMVITIEPGVYLPGVGGVRIEDDVLVGRDGPCRLSSLSTALAAMTLR